MEKETAYFIAVESEDTAEVIQKLTELGEYVNLVPGFYLLVTKEPKGKILLALDPLAVRSLKRYFIIESTNVIWNVFGDDRDGRIAAIIKRLS
jgi:hypothetical protein